jgi:glycosyltransferase involved in cell wall biosynthesis
MRTPRHRALFILKSREEVEMLQVFQVCPEFPFHGGVERHVLDLSIALTEHGAKVTVLATNPGNRLKNYDCLNGIEVRRFRSWNPNESYYFAPELYTFLASITSSRTVVHAHNYQALPVVMAALAKRRNHLPLVITPHFHPFGGTRFRTALKRIYRRVGRSVLQVSDAVIALSEFERLSLKTEFRLSDSKILVVPAGSERSIPRRRGVSDTILYVGRLEKYKGLDYLIRTLPLVCERVPTTRLLVVGSGPDEPRLRSLAKEIGVTSSVDFLGNVSSNELENLYTRAAVVALLSEYEAYSLVIGEALSHNVPVVASRVGAIPEIYGSEQNCFLVRYPPQIHELAQKVVQILTKPRTYSNTDAVTKRLTWKAVASRILDEYNALLRVHPTER